MGLFGKKPTSKFPPRMVGQWLAKHLDERCTLANIMKEQRDFAGEINLPIPKFFDELLCLSAFSIDFAALSLLNENPAKDGVRAGFMEGVQGWPAQSVNKSMQIQFNLQAKGQAYLSAAIAAVSAQPDTLGDPLSDVFCDFIFTPKTLEELSASQDVAAAAGLAHILATMSVQTDFWYYQNLSQGMFVEAGLI
jgi:hypothetical protein